MAVLHPDTNRAFIYTGNALAVALFSICLFGFSPFHAGLWNAEPITLAMFGISAFIALWLCVGTARGWLDVRFTRGNTLVLLWLAWIGWQCVVTLLSQSPWRSWFGPPEQSEGLAWYVCMGLFMLQLSALWQSIAFRRLIVWYSFALIMLLAILHFISDDQNNLLAGFIFPNLPYRYFFAWLPFVWPDYLGYMAAWWWIAAMIAFPDMAFRKLLALGWAMLFILLASSNMGAFIIASYAMFITLAVRYLQLTGRRHFRVVSNLWRKLAMVAIALPLVWLMAAPYLPVNFKNPASQSIPTRILLNHISLTALADEPSRLLLGRGWGRCTDDFFKYSLVRDVRIYDNAVHRPNWSLVRGYNYHSHNMAAETLLSLGIVGFMLWFLMPLVVVKRLPSALFWRVAPMLVAVRLLANLWFTMPQVMPLQALCWFLLIHACGTQPAAATRIRFLPAAMLAACVALLWSAVAQWDAIRYSTLLKDPFGYRYGTPVTVSLLEEDIKRGGDRLRTLFINTTKRFSEHNDRLEAKHEAVYLDYLQAVEAMADDSRIGAYNGAAVLYGYNTLLTTMRSPAFKEAQARASRNYFSLAYLHTRRAPLREDSIAPFLMALYESPRDPEHQILMDVVHELLQINPAHRSALWIGGKVLSKQAGMEQQGRDMMRDALKLGADRIFPIQKDEVAEVLSK